jgi:hypothetical protein
MLQWGRTLARVEGAAREAKTKRLPLEPLQVTNLASLTGLPVTRNERKVTRHFFPVAALEHRMLRRIGTIKKSMT